VYDTNAYNDTIYEQKNLLSKINGQHANEENEDEKALLYSQIAQLEQENNRLNVTIGSLTNMLQSQRIFAAMPLTRWKVISPGVCRLLSYSNAFLELTRHQPEKLHSCFTCVQLYPAKEFSKTQGFFDLISSGRVESFTARVPIVCASGHVVDIFSMIKIEFHNGIPATVCVCMKDFDHLHQEFENMPYFRPFMVKLCGARNMSSPDVNLEASLHCSPPLAMSVGEPTNLSPGHSNHPHMNERNSPPLQSTMAVGRPNPYSPPGLSPQHVNERNSPPLQSTMAVGRPTHPYSPDHPTHSRMNKRNSPPVSVVTDSSNVLSPVEQSLLEDSCMLMNFQVPINTERRQTDQSPGHEPSSGSSCSTYFNWSQNQVFEPFATTSNLFTDKDFGQSVRTSGCFVDPKAELGFNVDDFPFRQDPEFPRAKPLLQFEI
jgi:hypothetical protein